MFIGIDPDTEKSGFAIWQNKELFLYNLSFPKVQEFFLENKDKIKKVIISAGWLNKKINFRKKYYDKKTKTFKELSIGAREKSAMNTGQNHQVGKLIAVYCEHYNIKYELSKPKAKKLDADVFRKITGYKKRTNQDNRDAGILVYGI